MIPSHPEPLYVSEKGSDETGSGTEEKPFKTILEVGTLIIAPHTASEITSHITPRINYSSYIVKRHQLINYFFVYAPRQCVQQKPNHFQSSMLTARQKKGSVRSSIMIATTMVE